MAKFIRLMSKKVHINVDQIVTIKEHGLFEKTKNIMNGANVKLTLINNEEYSINLPIDDYYKFLESDEVVFQIH